MKLPLSTTYVLTVASLFYSHEAPNVLAFGILPITQTSLTSKYPSSQTLAASEPEELDVVSVSEVPTIYDKLGMKEDEIALGINAEEVNSV